MDATTTMTADRFIASPEPDRGRPWNLVNGEVVMNSARRVHDQAVSAVLVALSVWARDESGRGSAGGPIDVQTDELNVYAPDVHWYASGGVPERDARAPYPMPDLAVEVRSPSTWRYDVGAKRKGYERYGLRELWLADTESQTVLVFRRSSPKSEAFDVALELGEGDALTSPMLPGFALPVAEVFAAH